MKRTLDDVDYFSDSDEEVDRALVENLDRVEQLGGALGPLFRFGLQRIGQRRRWRQITDHMQFHSTLHQLRPPGPRDNIGLSLMEAMHEAIRTQITTLDNVSAQDRLHFAIQAHGFVHAFRSVNIEVGEFLRRSAYLNELLDTLAGKLNSNEQFDPQRGFQLDVVIIRMPRPGRGNSKRLNVGRRSMARDNTLKRCLVPINNKDELCCARAIVTMRAWCHRNDPGAMGGNHWNTLRRGLPRQTVQARELYQSAGVPEGPCGLEQLAAFQRVLSPQYQLKVMCRSKPFFILFRGPDAPHQIQLIKSDDHYEGCTSFSAFVNKSYWCHHCDRGFDSRGLGKHACEGRTCRACARDMRHPFPDYDKNRSPDTYCNECNRRFYGPRCFQYHRDNGQCQSWKTCRSCQATYQVKKGKRHRCGYAKCYSCQETVDMTQHRCYIQPPGESREPVNEEEEDPPPPPPQLVYADIEAMQTADRGFTANLLCYRHQDQRDMVTLKGEDCCERFMQHLDDLAYPVDRDVEE